MPEATEETTESLELTAEMLGQSLRVPKDEAYLLIQFGERRGWIRRIGTMPATNGRGRGASIYRIPTDFGTRLGALWDKRQGVQ